MRCLQKFCDQSVSVCSMLTLVSLGTSFSSNVSVEIMLSSKSIYKNCLTISLHSFALVKLIPLRRSLQRGSFLVNELSADSLISSSSVSVASLAACGTPTASDTFYFRKNLIWQPPLPSSTKQQSKRFKLSKTPSLTQMQQMNNQIRRSTMTTINPVITAMRSGK